MANSSQLEHGADDSRSTTIEVYATSPTSTKAFDPISGSNDANIGINPQLLDGTIRSPHNPSIAFAHNRDGFSAALGSELNVPMTHYPDHNQQPRLDTHLLDTTPHPVWFSHLSNLRDPRRRSASAPPADSAHNHDQATLLHSVSIASVQSPVMFHRDGYYLGDPESGVRPKSRPPTKRVGRISPPKAKIKQEKQQDLSRVQGAQVRRGRAGRAVMGSLERAELLRHAFHHQQLRTLDRPIMSPGSRFVSTRVCIPESGDNPATENIDHRLGMLESAASSTQKLQARTQNTQHVDFPTTAEGLRAMISEAVREALLDFKDGKRDSVPEGPEEVIIAAQPVSCEAPNVVDEPSL